MVGATPNGHLSSASPFDGMSPIRGVDKKGVMVAIKSVFKIKMESMSLVMAHNFKVIKNSLDSP